MKEEAKTIRLISPNLSEETHADVDGVYMPCNKWRITTVIERLENEFQKPVVTNTQAWVWEALRGMGILKPIPSYGRLLSRPTQIR